MQCPSCGLQIDQPNLDRCPRCGYQFASGPAQPPQYNPYDPYNQYPPSAPREPSTGSGAPQNPPPYNPNPYGQYGGYAPPSGYGQPVPPSGYGQPAPPSGYGQPYGQPAPPSYPMTSGYPPQGYPQAPQPKKSRAGLIIGIIVAVVVLLAACTGGTIWALSSLGQTTVTNLSGTPSASASPTPSEVVVYGDSFASNADGWPQDPGSCFLDKDGYHTIGSYLCYAPIGDQGDVTVTVTVQQASGPTTNGYGLVLRRVSKGNFYDFMIDSNSKWLFDKCVNDTCTTLVDFTANNAIKGGLRTTNTLKVTATGSHFDFFVNGASVGGFDDATFSSGSVGVAGGDEIECVFTNFIVSRPN